MISQPAHDAPTHETLVERLVTQNYSLEQATHVAERLLSLSGDLHEALLAWWNDQPLPPLTRGSYTLDTLQEKFGLTNIGALLTLDDIDHHPEETLSLLEHGLR